MRESGGAQGWLDPINMKVGAQCGYLYNRNESQLSLIFCSVCQCCPLFTVQSEREGDGALV